jgi:hypothetical protein
LRDCQIGYAQQFLAASIGIVGAHVNAKGMNLQGHENDFNRTGDQPLFVEFLEAMFLGKLLFLFGITLWFRS